MFSDDKLTPNKHIITSNEGTSYCALCEQYARENEKLRMALKNIVTHCEVMSPKWKELLGAHRIASEALKINKQDKGN